MSKIKSRYDRECRNGHPRTEHNTHIDRYGRRSCMDCPSWIKSRGTGAAARRRENRDAVVLPPAEVARLRSLLSCIGCGATPAEVERTVRGRDRKLKTITVVVTEHTPGCRVAELDEQPARTRKRAAA